MKVQPCEHTSVFLNSPSWLSAVLITWLNSQLSLAIIVCILYVCAHMTNLICEISATLPHSHHIAVIDPCSYSDGAEPWSELTCTSTHINTHHRWLKDVLMKKHIVPFKHSHLSEPVSVLVSMINNSRLLLICCQHSLSLNKPVWDIQYKFHSPAQLVFQSSLVAWAVREMSFGGNWMSTNCLYFSLSREVLSFEFNWN